MRFLATAAGVDGGRDGEGDVDAAAAEPGERVRGRVATLPAAVGPGDAGAQDDHDTAAAGKDS